MAYYIFEKNISCFSLSPLRIFCVRANVLCQIFDTVLTKKSKFTLSNI